ncbi:MAG TPA: hypothetical protein VH333_11350 [Pseudonocardiaceae bacterium]|nr:hypothetical protein [Pseudonocardiaceae bacterium]
MIVGLGFALAGVVVAAGFGTPANAATAVFPGPPWVYYKDLPDPASCDSAGNYFEQQGIIKGFLCDEVQPPSAFAAGDTGSPAQRAVRSATGWPGLSSPAPPGRAPGTQGTTPGMPPGPSKPLGLRPA